MVNYSIIIPCRDCLPLLQKATKSIPDRTDVEVLIVDNSIKTMEHQYQNNHDKATIKYLTSDPAKGAGHARNVGLDNATGKWLLFLDADDYFTDDAFSAFDDYLDSDKDIIFFDVKSVKLSSGEPCDRANYISRLLKYGNVDYPRYRLATPYCKMIRHQIIKDNNIRFQEVRVSNDSWFSLMAGHYCKNAVIDLRVCYCVTEGENNSSLTKQKSADNTFIRYSVAVEKNVFLDSIGRNDLRFPILSYVLHSLVDFGPKEFVRYLKLAKEKKQKLFSGVRL